MNSAKQSEDGHGRIEAFQEAQRLYSEMQYAQREIDKFTRATKVQIADFVDKQRAVIASFRDFDRGINPDIEPVSVGTSKSLDEGNRALPSIYEKQQRMVNNIIKNFKDAQDETDKLRIALERLAQLQSADFDSLIGIIHRGDPASLKMLSEYTGLPTNNKTNIADALKSINPEGYEQYYVKINAGKQKQYQQLLADEQQRQVQLNQLSQGYFELFDTSNFAGKMDLGKIKT